ncbi:hypothetical protein S7S_12835 [Isoalcanivorax pacificus W11-5]|uniref:Uncharacterized protein n=1 Tax=Isoalcanivorax pacificus W11-5 TaxID=391936 RepID=A0A0B4XL66_9GAMM|nr:hypothetical protein S7S_12835 [Isoalcanivorax pacificus W11-5]
MIYKAATLSTTEQALDQLGVNRARNPMALTGEMTNALNLLNLLYADIITQCVRVLTTTWTHLIQNRNLTLSQMAIHSRHLKDQISP